MEAQILASCIYNTILIRYWTQKHYISVCLMLTKASRSPSGTSFHTVLYVVCLVLLASYMGLRLCYVCMLQRNNIKYISSLQSFVHTEDNKLLFFYFPRKKTTQLTCF